MLKKFKISANKTEVGNWMLIDNIWNHFKSLPDFLNLGLKNYSGSNFNWKAQAKNLLLLNSEILTSNVQQQHFVAFSLNLKDSHKKLQSTLEINQKYFNHIAFISYLILQQSERKDFYFQPFNFFFLGACQSGIIDSYLLIHVFESIFL